jgi:hypothetical protein
VTAPQHGAQERPRHDDPRRLWIVDDHEVGPNLAKTSIVAKYNTVNQVDRLHGGTKPAHAVRE